MGLTSCHCSTPQKAISWADTLPRLIPTVRTPSDERRKTLSYAAAVLCHSLLGKPADYLFDTDGGCHLWTRNSLVGGGQLHRSPQGISAYRPRAVCELVKVTGFEPAAYPPQTDRSARLSYTLIKGTTCAEPEQPKLYDYR